MVRHVLARLVGSAALGYGVYDVVQPNQPPPANEYLIFILAIVEVDCVSGPSWICRR